MACAYHWAPNPAWDLHAPLLGDDAAKLRATGSLSRPLHALEVGPGGAHHGDAAAGPASARSRCLLACCRSGLDDGLWVVSVLAVGRWALGGMGRWDQEPWVEAKSGSILHLPIYLDAAGCTRYQISLDVEMPAMQRGQGRRGGGGSLG